MKKICITLALLSIIILSVGLMASVKPKTNEEYLRIHIRANSNDEVDQNVKYKVKSAVVEFLTPYIAQCNEKKDAEKMLNESLKKIEKVADSVLVENGFSYKSKASVKIEEFPTRKYEDFTLEKGFYQALIIELGSGEGDNWWCVVYPPLCFKDTSANYIYKSKILEIINNFRNKEKQ